MNDENKKEPQDINSGIHIGGNVGPGAAVGSHARVTAKNIAGGDINIGADAKDVADAFLRIYTAIETKKFDSEEQANTAREAVELIEEENAKGDAANEKIVKLSFQTIAQMAPDILDVVVASLVSPLTGISAVVKKIAEKAKAASESKGRLV